VNEGATEVVDAADDGELPWAWREPKSMATRSKGNSPPELDKKVYEWKKSQQAVVVRTVVHDLGSLGLEYFRLIEISTRQVAPYFYSIYVPGC
jgi:hypothetical protein